MLDLCSPIPKKFKRVVHVFVLMLVLAVCGFCTSGVALLTHTSCGILWQTAMVTADDVRKGLFTKLGKPKDVDEATAIADDVAVNGCNLALLFSVGKYPPPGYDMLPNTRDDFSYEGIVLALKNWQSIRTFAPAGVVSDSVIPGNLYH